MYIEIEITEEEIDIFRKFYDDLFRNNPKHEVIPILHKIIKSTDCVSRPERNERIFKMRENGATYTHISEKFGISRQRARQIYEREQREKNYYNRRRAYELNTYTPFFSCLKKACAEMGYGPILAIKTYRCLDRAGILKQIEDNALYLDGCTDEELMSIHQFGITMLDVTRKASDIYKSKQA